MTKYEELYSILTETYEKFEEDPGLHCGLLEYTFKDIIDTYSTWLQNHDQGMISRMDKDGYRTTYGIKNGKESTKKWGSLETRKKVAMFSIQQKIESMRKNKIVDAKDGCKIVNDILEEYFTQEEYDEVCDELIGFFQGYICKAYNPDKEFTKCPF